MAGSALRPGVRAVRIITSLPPCLHTKLPKWNIECTEPTVRPLRRVSSRRVTDFFGEKAIARSNESVGSRLFLDPYHVADGNLWAENFLMGRFQRGGMTSLAGRSKLLRFEPEKFGKEDMQSRARSKYLEPEGGRFVPPLKPACSRDKGPDPYGTHKHVKWTIQNTGYVGGMGTKSASAQTWSTYALARPNVSA